MHAMRGVRRAVGNKPRAACSTRAEPQSKLIDELCRELIRTDAAINPAQSPLASCRASSFCWW